MWKTMIERIMRMTATIIPSPNPPSPSTIISTMKSLPSRLQTPATPFLYPSPPTYSLNPFIIHPPPSSPPPNVDNRATTSLHSLVVVNPEATTTGTTPEPGLRTSNLPKPTPFHPTYAPDFVFIYSLTNTLQTSATLNPYPKSQIY